MDTILLEDGNCSIKYCESEPCLYLKIKGTLSNDQYRAYVLEGVHFFKSQNIKNANLRVIIDTSELDPIDKFDTEWTQNELTSLIHIENGIRTLALIEGVSAKAKERISGLYEKARELHIVKLFKNAEEAKAWFKEDIESSGIIGNYELYL